MSETQAARSTASSEIPILGAIEWLLGELIPRSWPQTLYHYTSASGLLAIVREKALWATDIWYLTDATAFKLALDIADSVLSNRDNTSANEDDVSVYRAWRHGLRAASKTSVFVSSFSTHPDQLSQWRGYCPSASGYSIAMSPGQIAAAASAPRKRYLFPCIYDGQRQRDLVTRLIDEIADARRQTARPPNVDVTKFEAAFQTSLVFLLSMLAPGLKHESFREEAEWRLVYAPNEAPAVLFRSGRSMLIPYCVMPLTTTGHALRLEEIVVGPTPHPETFLVETASLKRQRH